MNTLTGNIVTPGHSGYGIIRWENRKIISTDLTGEVRPDENWILPGFIDLHFHGLGNSDAIPENLHEMMEFAPRTGLTTIVPALASDTPEKMLEFVRAGRLCCNESRPGKVRFAGTHLEGPFLEYEHRGGMAANLIRDPDPKETERLLKEANGTLKLMTIAPELPHAKEVISLLVAAGVQVSAGHTGMKPEDLGAAVDAGVRQICHLFDAWDGREVILGVPVPAVSDLAIVEDRLMLELIADGIHVPPPLLKLAIRAAGAGRIVAITDAMRGTGLPDAVYTMTDGREFTLTNGDVSRLKDNPEVIVGSCLTMNMAFHNLVTRFGVSPEDAALMTAANPAKCLKLDHCTGSLKPGMDADITVLGADQLTVMKTVTQGIPAYEVHY